ncbi:MAG: glycosyltransferase family 1 protein [Oscillospiraceae bacterium]|jgi:glycosyltransferase involved in cell wall biosynthesis|nr:glycosyltransferase family 1 protein [Oscillospiraceae bacterium]
MIRILHVLHSMNLGGAEALLMSLYRRLDTDRYQFDFLVNEPNAMHFEREIAGRGGRIHRMPSLRAIGPFNYAKALGAFLAAHPEYRAVHSHLESTTGLILQAAAQAGVPLRIAHSHNTRFTRAGLLALPENALKSWCRKKINPNATHRLACSQAAAQWLFGDACSEVLRNGIDAPRFAFSPETRAQTRALLDIPAEMTVFLHIGRFQAQKNHTFLLDAWARLAPRFTQAQLLLAGEGVLQAAMQAKAKKIAGGDRVHFLGLREDIPALLSAADAFLLPSLFEGLPVVLVEAQAAGLPCFASDSIPREADLGTCAFLPLDAQIWAERLARFTPPHNRSAAVRAVEAAGYDIGQSLRRLEELYATVR